MKDIVIKGKYIVHGIYMFIIFILIVFLLAEIYKIKICVDPEQTRTTTSSTPKIVDIGTGRAVQTSTPSTTTSSQTTQNTADDSSNQDQDNESDEPPPEPEIAEPGVIKFTIENIEYEVKGDDWATVTSIKYKVENGKEDFYPLIQVYLFDDNDGDDIKSLKQDEIELPLLEEGEVVTKESNVHISYNEINRKKTLRLVLRNELGKELKVAVKKFDSD